MGKQSCMVVACDKRGLVAEPWFYADSGKLAAIAYYCPLHAGLRAMLLETDQVIGVVDPESGVLRAARPHTPGTGGREERR